MQDFGNIGFQLYFGVNESIILGATVNAPTFENEKYYINKK